MKYSIFLLVIISFYSCENYDHSRKTEKQIFKAQWTLSKQGANSSFKAEVPGLVHLDLLANGIIEDPFKNNNELSLGWIEEENWEYRSIFEVDKILLQNKHIEWEFEGLDTYAQVFINDKLVLEANNMFRSWLVDVKRHLVMGENEIRILFESPILHNKDKVLNYPHKLPSANETADIDIKVSSFTRKAAYQFGWDWGPRFVSSGIWRPIKVNVWNEAIIRDVYTKTNKISANKAWLTTTLEIEVDEAGEYELRSLDLNHIFQLKKGLNTLSLDFEKDYPSLWWCNGKGDAKMYSLNFDIYKDGVLHDSYEDSYGIRTIELINEKDSIGTAFYFKLNGEDVFIQGANYIPQDVFPTRVSEEQYRKLLSDVRAANINMLRVWGGGIYERDLFYELCDEYGILIWQDFMFANSLYPDDAQFKENVRMEVRDNVKRLRGHPCIALWCGNNEIEVAWKNWGWQESFNYSESDSIAIWENYLSLFHQLIPEEVQKLDQRPYVSTSPLSNWGKPENFNHSSMHYWGVWHGKEDLIEFENNVGRFMVEYGFQSFPELESLRKSISDSLLYLDSDVMTNRQKSYIGNGMILDQIRKNFKDPESFEEFVQLSQETQALALEIAIKAHKSKQPHCMGTIFWQLNDCWPGPSWSIIDYYGKHKRAYDLVQKEFATQP